MSLTPVIWQQELEERLRFEELIADLSLRFVNLPAAKVDEEIQEAIRQIAQCLGLDLIGLWQMKDEAPKVLHDDTSVPPAGRTAFPGTVGRRENVPLGCATDPG